MSGDRVKREWQQHDVVVDCPHCRDPFAHIDQRDIDIHAGATFTCRSCGGSMVLSAEKPEEYSRRTRT